MRDLKLNCKEIECDFSLFEAFANDIRLSVEGGSIILSKDQARQLHEWLGRYLENSDE